LTGAFEVKAGLNTDYVKVEVTFDSIAPDVWVNGAPGGWQNTDAQASVGCSDTGTGCNSSTYGILTYSSDPGTCSPDYSSYTIVGGGSQSVSSHSWVCAAAKDNAGNKGFSSPAEFKVDKDGLNIDSFGVLPAITNTNFTISWDISDTGGSHLYQVEIWRAPDSGGIPGDWGTSPIATHLVPAGLDSWSSSDTDSPSGGTWWYGLHISDNAGNTRTETESGLAPIEVIKDDAPPTVSIEGAPADWQNTDATASVSCSEAGSGCDSATYRIITYTSNPGTCPDVYSIYTLTSPKTISSHLWVCGTAKDLGGNVGFSTPVEFKVDKILPFTGVISPSGGSWHKNDFTATITDLDYDSGLVTTCEYLVVGLNPLEGPDCSSGILTRNCGSTNINVFVGSGTCGPDNICRFEGENQCKVSTKSFDNAGNTSGWKSKHFSIDWTPPVVGEISPLNATQWIEQTFNASLTDPVGKIIGCWFYVDGAYKKQADSILPIPCENGADCTVSVDYTFTSSGDFSAQFSCQDEAGHIDWGDPVTISVAEGESITAPIITSLDYYSCHCTAPEQKCLNQFNCCLKPLTQDGCCVKFNIEAYDPDANPLTYNWNFGDGNTTTTEDPSHHYEIANTYTVTVSVFDGTETTQDQLIVGVGNPTLSVSLSANPSFGIDSLSNVDLRAIVSGSMFGTINYKFDCTNNASWELEVSNQSIDDYIAGNLCSYLTPASYTAKAFIQRGTGSAQDTTEINVVASACMSGEQTVCTSPQGCSHTITCQGDGTWPPCPSDECVKSNTQDCGNCGTQTCSDLCAWGACAGEGECSPGPDCSLCPCPTDSCVGRDYYDYPDFGDCDSYCSCDTGTGIGQPCDPTIYVDDSRCNQAPICDSLIASPSAGIAPLDVLLTGSGHDADGAITQYEFDLGDGSPLITTSSNSVEYTYNTPATYCARLRVQDNDGIWSETPVCPSTCGQEITVSPNNPPQAAISCDATNCGPGSYCDVIGTWIAYNRNCQFNLLNQSTDPDSTNPENNNDIVKSIWSIFYEDSTPCEGVTPCPWQDPWVTCIADPVCDMQLPALPANKSYYAKLYVEDNVGASNETQRDFYVRREAIADFECSLKPEEGWQRCGDNFRVSEGEIAYFRDTSLASEGATSVSFWSWTFTNGIPSTSNLQNPSASFEEVDAVSGTVKLEITDNVGRTDSRSYQVLITVPLPEWREVPPF